MKQVYDPETPARAFRVDEAAKQVVAAGNPPVISQFDQIAVEAALRVRAASTKRANEQTSRRADEQRSRRAEVGLGRGATGAPGLLRGRERRLARMALAASNGKRRPRSGALHRARKVAVKLDCLRP